MFRIIPPLAILSLAIAGCVTATPQGAPPLAESRWRFTAIDGAEPDSPDARLEFHAGGINANVGCNDMGGQLQVEGGHLTGGTLIITLALCKKAMDQERTVSTLLSSAPEVVVRGRRMTLRAAGHSAELTRE